MAAFKRIAKELKVEPPINAPAFVWNFAWKLHMYLIPILHSFDHCFAVNSSFNLAVLWWKAISANRWGSLLWDNGITFDLLPPIFRRLVQFPLSFLYPNLHHQNIAMRTVFLDDALRSEILNIENNQNSKVRVIILGSGYDSRSLRFLNTIESEFNTSNVDFFEFDLPSVVNVRHLMLERFVQRRKVIKKIVRLPTVLEADLNNLDEFTLKLDQLLDQNNKSIFDTSIKQATTYTKTIFIMEAVVMYLNDEVVMPLCQQCVRSVIKNNPLEDISLCFADRFPGIVNVDNNTSSLTTFEKEREDVAAFLLKSQLQLTRWMPKLGRARHMGVAKYIP